MKIETDTKQGGTSMRRWGSIRMLLSLLAAIALAALLAGCPDDDDDDDAQFDADSDGNVLTTANAASIGGLTFTFADGAIFGAACAGETTTLEIGENGLTFTLMCPALTVTGDITFSASCTLTPVPANTNLAPTTYDTCETNIEGGIVSGGSSFTGATTLLLAEAGDPVVSSNPVDAEYDIDNEGNVSRNDSPTIFTAPPVTGVTGGASN